MKKILIEQFRDKIFIISTLQFLNFSQNAMNEYSELNMNRNTFKRYIFLEKELINEIIEANLEWLEILKKDVNSKSISFVMNEINKKIKGVQYNNFQEKSKVKNDEEKRVETVEKNEEKTLLDDLPPAERIKQIIKAKRESKEEGNPDLIALLAKAKKNKES